MKNKKTIPKKTSAKTYAIGFILSLILTVGAYYLVTLHSHYPVVSYGLLPYILIALAFVQLLVQVFFFLHLGREPKYRWNLIFFISTVGLILIIVVGALWIMNHLNYNMTPQQINHYLQNQNGF